MADTTTFVIASVSDVQTAQQSAFTYTETLAEVTLAQANSYTDLIAARTVHEILEPLVPPSPEGLDNAVLEILHKEIILEDGSASVADIFLPTVGFVDANLFRANVEAKSYTNLKVAEIGAQAQTYTNSKYTLNRDYINSKIDQVNTRIDELAIAGFTKEQWLEYADYWDAN